MPGSYILSYRDTSGDIEPHKTFFDLKRFKTFAEAYHATQLHPNYRSPTHYFYIYTEEADNVPSILWSYNIRSGTIDHRFNTFADCVQSLVLHFSPNISAEDLAEKTSALRVEDL